MKGRRRAACCVAVWLKVDDSSRLVLDEGVESILSFEGVLTPKDLIFFTQSDKASRDQQPWVLTSVLLFDAVDHITPLAHDTGTHFTSAHLTKPPHSSHHAHTRTDTHELLVMRLTILARTSLASGHRAPNTHHITHTRARARARARTRSWSCAST